MTLNRQPSGWYNPTISKAVIKQALVQFMDNSEDLISGDEILDMSDKTANIANINSNRKRKSFGR